MIKKVISAIVNAIAILMVDCSGARKLSMPLAVLSSMRGRPAASRA